MTFAFRPLCLGRLGQGTSHLVSQASVNNERTTQSKRPIFRFYSRTNNAWLGDVTTGGYFKENLTPMSLGTEKKTPGTSAKSRRASLAE